MASYGLEYLAVAKRNPPKSEEKYGAGVVAGKMITMGVTENFVEGSLYADNTLAEYAKEFRSASVSLNTDRVTVAAIPLLTGHTVSTEGGKTVVVSKADDAPDFVGAGTIRKTIEDGLIEYKAVLLHKVKFSPTQESFSTKGDNIAFGTPTLEGTAVSDDEQDGEWRREAFFGSFAEAKAYIDAALNVGAEDGE